MWQHSDSLVRRICGSGLLACLAFLLTSSGCEGPEVPRKISSGTKPFAGVSLRVVCGDEQFVAALKPLVKSWAGRSGATVELVAGPLTPEDSADAAILPPQDLGAWAERGDLRPVPASIYDGKAFQWNEIFIPYRDRLSRWGSKVYAVPLAGDGRIVVYRSDLLADPKVIEKFRSLTGRNPSPPITWDEFAELAECLREVRGSPSLPPLSSDSARVVELFFRVAASYERTIQTEGTGAGEKLATSADALSYQFDIANGKPRLKSPGFVSAAAWLHRIQACRPVDGGGDAITALVEGRAALAMVDLRDLARLPRENGVVPPRFGIAKLPGVARETTVNYIPYFASGRFGVVRTRCTQSDAAFDLLAELGSPVRSSEVIAAGAGGPYRGGQFERSLWLGYGFDPERTSRLVEDLRAYVAVNATNGTYTLRGPDQAELTNALAAELKEIVMGRTSPTEGLARADASWLKLDAAHAADVLRWRRRAMGLD